METRQSFIDPSQEQWDEVDRLEHRYFEKYGVRPKRPECITNARPTMASVGKYIGDIREMLGKSRSSKRHFTSREQEVNRRELLVKRWADLYQQVRGPCAILVPPEDIVGAIKKLEILRLFKVNSLSEEKDLAKRHNQKIKEQRSRFLELYEELHEREFAPVSGMPYTVEDYEEDNCDLETNIELLRRGLIEGYLSTTSDLPSNFKASFEQLGQMSTRELREKVTLAVEARKRRESAHQNFEEFAKGRRERFLSGAKIPSAFLGFSSVKIPEHHDHLVDEIKFLAELMGSPHFLRNVLGFYGSSWETNASINELESAVRLSREYVKKQKENSTKSAERALRITVNEDLGFLSSLLKDPGPVWNPDAPLYLNRAKLAHLRLVVKRQMQEAEKPKRSPQLSFLAVLDGKTVDITDEFHAWQESVKPNVEELVKAAYDVAGGESNKCPHCGSEKTKRLSKDGEFIVIFGCEGCDKSFFKNRDGSTDV